jgi:hypothetical protein
MLPIIQLVQRTPQNIQNNAKHVTAQVVSVFNDVDHNGLEHKVVLIKALGNTIGRYVVYKIYNADGKRGPANKVWVTCSCEYWLYYCEVAVDAKGSTSILKSNGEMPKIRNPGMVPHLCKHLLAGMQQALDAKPHGMILNWMLKNVKYRGDLNKFQRQRPLNVKD